MFSLFAYFERKKRKRVEKYKEEYRMMSPGGQELHRKTLVQSMIRGNIYNRVVNERMHAVAEVHTERGIVAGSEEEELRILKELKTCVEAALH